MLLRFVTSHPIEPHTHMGEILSPAHCSGNVVLFDGQRVILGATLDDETPSAPAPGARAAFVADADPSDTRPPILQFNTTTGPGLQWISDLRPVPEQTTNRDQRKHTHVIPN